MAKRNRNRNRNALTHGIYSSDVVMLWENSEDFSKLLAGLRDFFQPEGVALEEVVFDIAMLEWRKRRFYRVSQVALGETPFGVQAADWGENSAGRMHIRQVFTNKYREQEREKFEKEMTGLSRLVRKLASEIDRRRKSGKALGGFLERFRKLEGRLTDLRTRIDEIAPIGDADASHALDILDKSTAGESRLEGLIQRKTQRYFILKDLRRQLCLENPKLIEHSASPALQSPISDAGEAPAHLDNNNDDNNNDDNNNDDNNNDDNNNDGSGGDANVEKLFDRVDEIADKLCEKLSKPREQD